MAILKASRNLVAFIAIVSTAGWLTLHLLQPKRNLPRATNDGQLQASASINSAQLEYKINQLDIRLQGALSRYNQLNNMPQDGTYGAIVVNPAKHGVELEIGGIASEYAQLVIQYPSPEVCKRASEAQQAVRGLYQYLPSYQVVQQRCH